MEVEVPTGSMIRDDFFSFFQQYLKPWPSRPLIPVDDRTLPLMHAALNHFKQAFLRNPPGGQGGLYSLKCVRISDSLGDFDEISHHSLSEILGTWSGWNYKRPTIGLLWQFLTEEYKLPAERIYVTYFGGDEKSGLAADTETCDMWKAYLPEDRIVKCTSKETFWNVCDTGPCGPCSGIYYDHIGDRDPHSSMFVNDSTCPQIWKLVFVEFNREADGSLRHLEDGHVITGMDFECITAILQYKINHYDTDIFKPIFDAIYMCAGNGIPAYSDCVGEIDTAYRVTADYLRIISVAAAEHTQIGEGGRKYFLKLMDKRAIGLCHHELKLFGQNYSELVTKSLQGTAAIIRENKIGKARRKQIVDDEVVIYKNTLAEIEYENQLLEKKDQSGTKQDNKNTPLSVPSPPMRWYKTRLVNFRDRMTHIIYKDKTSQHSIVALCNALLLAGKITLESNVTEISEGHLIHLVQMLLLCGSVEMELQESLTRSHLQKQVLYVLLDLSRELYMDVKFDSINGIVDSPQRALFDYLRVPLLHGWLVDPQDEMLTSAISRSFVEHSMDVALYESRQNTIAVPERENDDHKDAALDAIAKFFRGPQLTVQGLKCLREELSEKEPCVLLWNGALITITKVDGQIYFLANDTSFLTRDTSIVWQLLKEVNKGGSFMDDNFSTVCSNLNIDTLPLTKEDRQRLKKRAYKNRHSKEQGKMIEGQKIDIPTTTETVDALSEKDILTVSASLEKTLQQKLDIQTTAETVGALAQTVSVSPEKIPQQMLDIQSTSKTGDVHVDLPIVALPSSRSTSNRTYEIRQIVFSGHQTPIILQDANGPCSLIAICNALLLNGGIRFETNANTITENDLVNILQKTLETTEKMQFGQETLFRIAKRRT